MATVRLSAKFEIVIPREIREGLGLRPGQQMTLLEHENSLTITPEQPLKKLRGILRRTKVDDLRDKKDRFL